MRAIGIVSTRDCLHQADRVDRHAGLLQLFAGLIEGDFAEGVDAGSDEHDGLTAFDFAHAVGRIGDGVEQVGFGKAGMLRRRIASWAFCGRW